MSVTSQEHVYYADKEIWVTDRRILSSGGECWYNKIREIRTATVDYRRKLVQWMFVWLILIISFILVELLILRSGPSLDYPPFDIIDGLYFWGLIALGGIAFVTVLSLFGRIPKGLLYTIQVVNRLPGRVVLTSVDKAHAERVLGYINLAFANYRMQSDITEHGQNIVRSALQISPDTRVEERAPVIVGSLLVAGDNAYPLAEVKSVHPGFGFVGNYVWKVTGLFGVVLLNSVVQYASDLFGGAFHTIAFVTSLGVALAPIAFSSFLAAGANRVHLVIVRGTFGRVIVYATLNKAEAGMVKDEISAALARQGALLPT